MPSIPFIEIAGRISSVLVRVLEYQVVCGSNCQISMSNLIGME